MRIAARGLLPAAAAAFAICMLSSGLQGAPAVAAPCHLTLNGGSAVPMVCPNGMRSGTVDRKSGEVDFYSEAPSFEIEGSPVNVDANYERFLDDFLTPAPNEWGEPYVDGHSLVLPTATRSIEDATAVLKADGIGGAFEVVAAKYSQTGEETRMQVLTNALMRERIPSVSVVYLDPKSGCVIVGLTSNSDPDRAALRRLPRVGSDLIAYAEGPIIFDLPHPSVPSPFTFR